MPIIMFPNIFVTSFSNLLIPEFSRFTAVRSSETLTNICNTTGASSDYILFGNKSNSSVSNRILKILQQLPPEANTMVYNMVSSLKDLYEHK